MIELSNGYRFEHMAASGALKFDGKGWPWEQPLRWCGFLDPSLFTVVIKTLTCNPRKGNLHWYNPFGCIRFLQGGTLNAVGLTNPGINWWCEKIGPKVNQEHIALVGSIFSDAPHTSKAIDELVTMAGMLQNVDLVGLEINASCPNIGHNTMQNVEHVVQCCKAVRKESRFPIILKLSVLHDIRNIIPGIEGVIEAISINSVPWIHIFPRRRSPLAHLGGGGVSGKAAQPFTWELVRRLVEMTSIPVIGPSVWEFSDIQTLRAIGAKAISFGSIFLRYPWRPTLFVRKDKEKGVSQWNSCWGHSG